jgi:hypothetical protein
VGAVQRVRLTVYGTAPSSQPIPKHPGDGVVFHENIETWDNSGAVLPFIDGSLLTLGPKSRVLVDEFVFDPDTASGNALIRIAAGTLRWITGSMPKGRTVIKTPTSTMILRGTDVAVHVHPDGTTDAIVYSGSVENRNEFTHTSSLMGPGDQQTSDESGNHANTGDAVDPGDIRADRVDSNDWTRGSPTVAPAKDQGGSGSPRPQTAD